MLSNLGVVGALDENNHLVLTQSFVHRTHQVFVLCLLLSHDICSTAPRKMRPLESDAKQLERECCENKWAGLGSVRLSLTCFFPFDVPSVYPVLRICLVSRRFS
jgi:hypothetical protein